MAPPRSRGQPRGENRAPARNGAATLDVAALPAKHRAVRNFIKAVPPDQREDALIQAVLVGINTINSNTGKGAAGARPAEPEEREDAPDSGPGEADKTQWIHPADIETQSDTINGSEAGDTALTVDELDPPADNRQGALDPRIYPDWWGWDDGEPAEQQKAPAKKTSSVSTNSGYVENRAVRMQTRPTAPIRNGARAQESSPTQTITTTTTTVTVVEPLANAARPPRAPPKSASVGSHPQPKTQPEPLRSQRPKAMSWEVPFRDPPAGRRAEPSPTTRKPLFQRNPPSEPPHSPEPEPSEPPTIRKPTNERAGRSASASAAHIRRDRTSSRAEIPEEPSQRAGLLHLVRDFLKDPLVECLDLEVLNMRLEEDEEYGFEAESSDLYGLDESMGCLSPG